MIATRRLTLRPAQDDDLAALHEIFSDPETMRYWERPAFETRDLTRDFLRVFMTADWSDREEYILDLDGQCIGKAGCWTKAEVGYILHRDHWGKGLCFEAMEAIIPRAFAKFLDVPALTAEADPRNTGSVQLLKKLGFQQTRLEKQNFDYGGIEMCDTAYFELPRPTGRKRIL